MPLDPAKIVSNLITGKGASGKGGKLTGSRSPKSKGTPVAGAVNKAQKTLESLLGGGGTQRSSGSASVDTRTAGEVSASTAEGRAKVAKAKQLMAINEMAKKQGITPSEARAKVAGSSALAGVTLGLATGSAASKATKTASMKAKKSMSKARKQGKAKKVTRARRRVSRRS